MVYLGQGCKGPGNGNRWQAAGKPSGTPVLSEMEVSGSKTNKLSGLSRGRAGEALTSADAYFHGSVLAGD